MSDDLVEALRSCRYMSVLMDGSTDSSSVAEKEPFLRLCLRGYANDEKTVKVVRDSFGSNKMCQFFVKTYCLWHKQLENEIILGGHRAPFFRKWVRTLLFSTFLSME